MPSVLIFSLVRSSRPATRSHAFLTGWWVFQIQRKTEWPMPVHPSRPLMVSGLLGCSNSLLPCSCFSCFSSIHTTWSCTGCAFRIIVPWKIFKDVSSCVSLDLCLALVMAAALSRNLSHAAVFLTASQYEPVVSAQRGIQGLFL